MLTVLFPVYELDKFLQTAIESIKNQSYKNFTCIILTRELNEDEIISIKNIISDDKRFTIHQLKLDGIAFALNYGLNIVNTKYVARMDADDISHPLRFEKQIKFLEDNPNHVLIGCRVKIIDEFNIETNQKFKFFQGNNKIRRALKYRMPLCHPALIFRTKTLLENRGYMYGTTSEDHEIYIRIARNSENLFENLSENLFSYRKRPNQLTDMKNAYQSFADISGFLFTEFLRTYNLLYLVGIFANHPFLRKFRSYYRKFKVFILR